MKIGEEQQQFHLYIHFHFILWSETRKEHKKEVDWEETILTIPSTSSSGRVQPIPSHTHSNYAIMPTKLPFLNSPQRLNYEESD